MTDLYCGLRPAQSSSFVGFGVTVPAAGAALAVVEALAIAVMPARLSWQTTATPSMGSSSSRHLRRPAACACRQSRYLPRAADHATVTVPIRDASRRNLTTITNNRQ